MLIQWFLRSSSCVCVLFRLFLRTIRGWWWVCVCLCAIQLLTLSLFDFCIIILMCLNPCSKYVQERSYRMYVGVGTPLSTICSEPCFYEDVNPLMCKWITNHLSIAPSSIHHRALSLSCSHSKPLSLHPSLSLSLCQLHWLVRFCVNAQCRR